MSFAEPTGRTKEDICQVCGGRVLFEELACEDRRDSRPSNGVRTAYLRGFFCPSDRIGWASRSPSTVDSRPSTAGAKNAARRISLALLLKALAAKSHPS